MTDCEIRDRHVIIRCTVSQQSQAVNIMNEAIRISKCEITSDWRLTNSAFEVYCVAPDAESAKKIAGIINGRPHLK